MRKSLREHSEGIYPPPRPPKDWEDILGTHIERGSLVTALAGVSVSLCNSSCPQG